MKNYKPTRLDRMLYSLRILMKRNRVVISTNAISVLSGMLLDRASSSGDATTLWQDLKSVFAFNWQLGNIVTWVAVAALILPHVLIFLTNLHYKFRGIEKRFEDLLQDQIEPSIQEFAEHNLAWGTSLNLQQVPDLTEGWKPKDITVSMEPREFSIPKKWGAAYQQFYEEQKDAMGFQNDGVKYMVIQNPSSFTDAPTLHLKLMKCKYSEVQFYRYHIATDIPQRNLLITEAFEDNLLDFPHALCLHLVVVTKNNKILITRRSSKVGYFDKTWSVSMEEQFHEDDFRDTTDNMLKSCVKRMMLDELSVTDEQFSFSNLRILSVFMETNVMNVSLAGVLRLDISDRELALAYKSAPRKDYEIREFAFITFQEALDELLNPQREYHPTAGYRMLLALYNTYGPLKMIHRLIGKGGDAN